MQRAGTFSAAVIAVLGTIPVLSVSTPTGGSGWQHRQESKSVGPERDRSPLTRILTRRQPAIVGVTSAMAGPDAATRPESSRSMMTRVSRSVYSGPTPQNDAWFAEMAAVGVQTIVSVDGARPDVESAAHHGLRYVHIPIGYDGVPREAVAALTRVMRQCRSPVYVHCHHGKHRGPAAAAVCGMIAGQLDHSEAVAFLESAGTSRDYAGLWRDVRRFEPLPPGESLPELVAIARTEPLVEAMVRIDERFETLTGLLEPQQGRKPSTPDPRPAIDSAIETGILLREDFRESSRLAAAEHPPEFTEVMRAAEERAAEVVARLPSDPPAAAAALETLRQTCQACHRRFRD